MEIATVAMEPFVPQLVIVLVKGDVMVIVQEIVTAVQLLVMENVKINVRDVLGVLERAKINALDVLLVPVDALVVHRGVQENAPELVKRVVMEVVLDSALVAKEVVLDNVLVAKEIALENVLVDVKENVQKDVLLDVIQNVLDV